MKKNILFFLALGLLAVLSCRTDGDEIQRIDQIMHLYIDSAGQDMLNANLSNTYDHFTTNDLHADTDNAPVSMSLNVDEDSVFYINYIAGAARILVDSIDENHKNYESLIEMSFKKQIDSSITVTVKDTMKINYSYTSEAFQIESVIYNHINVFNKIPGQPNIVKVTK